MAEQKRVEEEEAKEKKDDIDREREDDDVEDDVEEEQDYSDVVEINNSGRNQLKMPLGNIGDRSETSGIQIVNDDTQMMFDDQQHGMLVNVFREYGDVCVAKGKSFNNIT